MTELLLCVWDWLNTVGPLDELHTIIFSVVCPEVTFPIASLQSVIVTAVVQVGGLSVTFTVEH